MTTEDRVGLATISCLFALFRVLGERGEVYQALAHLWVGGLIGHAAATRSRFTWTLAVVLSLIELACFIAGVIR